MKLTAKIYEGAPPSIGWWPAGVFQKSAQSGMVLRWWDGKNWSFPAGTHNDSETAEQISRVKTFRKKIYYTDRPKNWPAQSYT